MHIAQPLLLCATQGRRSSRAKGEASADAMALLLRAVYSVLKQESFVNTLPAPARYLLPHRSMSVQVGLQNVQDSPTVMYLPKEKALQLIPTPMMHSLPDVKVCQYGSKNVLNYTMTRISPLHKQPHPQVFMSFSFSSEIMGSAMVRPCLRFQSKGRHAHMCRNQWIAKRNLSLKRNIKFPWQEATSFGQQQAFLRWKSNMKTMAGTVVKSFILPTKEFLMKCMVFLKNASLAFVRIIRRGFVARLVDICFTYFVLVLVGTVLYVVDVLTGGKLGIFVDTGEEVDLDEYLTPGTSVSRYVLLKLAVKSVKEMMKARKELADMKGILKEAVVEYKRLSSDNLARVQQILLPSLRELKVAFEDHSMDEEKGRAEILSRLHKVEDELMELSKLKEAVKETGEVSNETALDDPKDE